MRIIIIPHGFQDHYSIGFANGVANRGVDVEFISTSDMAIDELSQAVRRYDLGQNKDASLPVIHRLKKLVLYHSRLMVNVVRRKGSVFHVIGLLRHVWIMGFIEGLWLRLWGSKYVLTVHDLLPHDKHTHLNRVLFSIVYRIPDQLVVHTSKMKEELIKGFGISGNKITVMEHGLNDVVQDHGLNKSKCRKMLGIPDNRQILLFFGRVAPYKGIEEMLESFRKLGDEYFLVIAGMPNESTYGDSIRDLVLAHPKSSSIRCDLRWVESEQIATYFRAADMLLIPYKHIDQSGVIFLALRFDMPVVAYDVGALRNYMVEGRDVIVSSTGPEEFADGIRTMSRRLADNKQHTGKEIAEKYSWANVVIPVVEIYQGKTALTGSKAGSR